MMFLYLHQKSCCDPVVVCHSHQTLNPFLWARPEKYFQFEKKMMRALHLKLLADDSRVQSYLATSFTGSAGTNGSPQNHL